MSKLDDLLRDAPFPPLASGAADDASWDEHGDAVLARVKANPRGDAAALEALLAEPALEPEPGEPRAAEVTSRVDPPSIRDQVGATKMSDSDRPKPSQRRPSLKELAERVSKTPPPPSVSPASIRPSAPPSPPSSLSAVATPPPSSLRTPIPSVPASSAAPVSAAPSASLPASTPPSQPERTSAPPSAASAPASTAAVAKDSAAKTAPVVTLASAKAKQEEKSGGGMGGILIAVIGLAAAAGLFFFLKSGDDAQKKQVATQTPVTTTTVVVTATAEATQTAQAEVPKEAPKDDTLDLEDLAEASGSAAESALPAGTGALPSTASAVAQNDSKDPKQPFVPNPDGTLDDAMRKAAGDPDKKEEAPQPASEDKGPKNVPDQPPVGSVNAYVAAARSAAKGCVAGADAPTTATVTFGPSGSVSKVSVGGWAAGKPAASCVDGAMRGRGVEPFSKPSYSVTVTVRP